VKRIIPRLAFSAATLAAALCFGIHSPAHAYGDEKWCAVTDNGGGSTAWNCDYETVEECTPAVTSGGRGYCALNPTWRPDPSTQR
jgi:hypothetical protein